MKILLVSATRLELEPLCGDLLSLKPGETKDLGKHTLTWLLTGPGMVSTAFAMGNILAGKTFDVGICAGICGSFTDTLKKGSVVCIGSDCLSELGAEDNTAFIPAHAWNMPESESNMLFAKKIINTLHYQHASIEELPLVHGITVNTVLGNAAHIKQVADMFSPDVETMENAAFLYACLQHKLQNISLRAVSNRVAVRDKSTWDIPLAVKNLCATLHTLLQEL